METKTMPKIVHQIWLGQNPFPVEAQAWRLGVQKFLPDWGYRLWGDADIKELEKDFLCPEFILDERIGMGIRPNVLRFELLRLFGGLYLDHDMELLGSIEEIMIEDCLHFGFDLPGMSTVGTAILASPPGHPFWEFYLKRIKATVKPQRPENPWEVLSLTGPEAFHRAIHDWLKGDYTSQPMVDTDSLCLGHLFDHGSMVGWTRESVFPYHITEHDFAGFRAENFPRAFAAHHWQGEWFREDAEAKKRGDATGAGLVPEWARKTDFIKILGFQVHFGTLGVQGKLGYKTEFGENVSLSWAEFPPQKFECISAHGPSTVTIEASEPIRLCGWLDGSAKWIADRKVTYLVDDMLLGYLARPQQRTAWLELGPGKHTLTIWTENPWHAHTGWFTVKSGEGTKASAHPKLRVVTSAFYPEATAYENLRFLSNSLLNWDLPLSVLGIGCPFKSFRDSKISQLRAVLGDCDADLILYTDCRDSFIVGSQGEVVEKFHLCEDKDFLISMESQCWPIRNQEWADSFPTTPSGLNWPNGGGYIGTKEGVIRILGRCEALAKQIEAGEDIGFGKFNDQIRTHADNDQLLMQILYLRGEILGDIESRIFTNVGTADHCLTPLNQDYDFVGNRVRMKSNGSVPSVIHFSGPQWERCGPQWAAALGLSV